MSNSLQHWVGRNRPPRVQITYDVEIGDAVEKKELPLVVGLLADLSGKPVKPLPKLKERRFVEVDRDNFDSVMGAWREEGAFGLHGGLLGTAARASVRSEIAEEVADYTESGVPASTALAEAFGELPELRDAMSMVWRILVLWLAVIALFVIAGWVS